MGRQSGREFIVCTISLKNETDDMRNELRRPIIHRANVALVMERFLKKKGDKIMENYSLQSNEVVLYKGNASIDKRKSNTEGFLTNITFREVMLTNINIVLILKSKKMFSKEEIDIQVFPVADIKIFNDIPQIKQSDYKVVIYLINEEITLSFPTKSEARKFVGAVYEFVTGKSLSERGASKVKGTINVVNDALGIDAVDTLKNVAENGLVGNVFGSLGKKTMQHAKSIDAMSEVLNATKGLLGKKTSEEESTKSVRNIEMSIDDQIESLKKLKELLDCGILTQEEFDAKKRQIMGN